MTETIAAPTEADLPDFDAVWNEAEPAESEKRFREFLADNPEAPLGWRLQLETQIARALCAQRKFGEAHSTLLGVIKRLDNTPAAAIRHWIERGRVHSASGSPDQALDQFERAFRLAEEHKKAPLAVDAAFLLGSLAPREDALEWHLKALEIAQGIDDDTALRAAQLVGDSLVALGRDEEAQPYYERAQSTERSG